MLQKANKNLDRLGGIKYTIPSRSRERIRHKLGGGNSSSVHMKAGEPGSILQKLYERRSKHKNFVNKSQDVLKKPPRSPKKIEDFKSSEKKKEHPFPSIANVHSSSIHEKTPKKILRVLPPKAIKSSPSNKQRSKTPLKEIEVTDKPLNSA